MTDKEKIEALTKIVKALYLALDEIVPEIKESRRRHVIQWLGDARNELRKIAGSEWDK